LAIRHSRGRVIAIQDADLEYDPVDLLRVIWPILDGNAEVVYGSRYLGQTSDPSLLHQLGNRMLTFFSNLTTGLRLTDMETCHKAFHGDLLRSIPLRECRFGFEPEITAKIANRDARVIEVPTNYQGRGYDEGKKIGWRDALAAVGCMWTYRNA
jgi:glycosyltransferase involved in cell wall biosynthesis